MQITGQCHCGQYQYRAKIDPGKISICHCTDCQVLTGCAYRISVHVPVEDFELKSGALKTYVKIADDGEKRAQAFCPECGTPLYAESLENPVVRSLRVGSIHQRAELKPHRQIWCRSALPWVQDLSKITPKFDQDGDWSGKM